MIDTAEAFRVRRRPAFFIQLLRCLQPSSDGIAMMIFSRCKRLTLLFAAVCLAPADLVAAGDQPEAPRVRTFQFTYAATITGMKPGQDARVWLPVPPSDDDQEVK